MSADQNIPSLDDATTLEDLKAMEESALLYCYENDLELCDADL